MGSMQLLAFDARPLLLIPAVSLLLSLFTSTPSLSFLPSKAKTLLDVIGVMVRTRIWYSPTIVSRCVLRDVWYEGTQAENSLV